MVASPKPTPACVIYGIHPNKLNFMESPAITPPINDPTTKKKLTKNTLKKMKRKKRIVSGYYYDGKKMTILYEKRR